MVPPSDLKDIVVRVSSTQELRKKVRVASDIIKSSRHGVMACIPEIRSDANMLDPSNLSDMLDVIRDVGNCRARVRIFLLLVREALANRLVCIKVSVEVPECCSALSLPVRVFRRDELLDEVRVDDATIGRQQSKNIVWDIAWVRCNGECVGVREYYRRPGDPESIAHSVRADVREIHEHSESIHFTHKLLAQLRQAIVVGPVGRSIGPIDVVPMGQRHVAGSQFVKNAQGSRGVLNHVAAFDTEEASDTSGSVDPLDVICRSRLLPLGPASNNAQRHVELAKRLMQSGVSSLRGRCNVD